MRFKVILMSYDNRIQHLCSCIIEFIILVAKRDKMLGKPCIYIFLPTYLINSIKHEHSCKFLFLLYVIFGKIMFGIAECLHVRIKK